MDPAYESDVPATTPQTPQIPQVPECDVERLDDGRLKLTHKSSGETAIAEDDGEDLIVQATILRTGAAWQQQLRRIQPPWTRAEMTFRTGDIS